MRIEVMKQTFDFLHDLWDMKQTVRSDRHKKVMWELDRAIEQAEKEEAEFQDFVGKVKDAEKKACEIINREWVGLTDEEIRALDEYSNLYTMPAFARAIEAKLKEKNHG